MARLDCYVLIMFEESSLDSAYHLEFPSEFLIHIIIIHFLRKLLISPEPYEIYVTEFSGVLMEYIMKILTQTSLIKLMK